MGRGGEGVLKVPLCTVPIVTVRETEFKHFSNKAVCFVVLRGRKFQFSSAFICWRGW